MTDQIEQLKLLHEFLQQGIISQQDYDLKKVELLQSKLVQSIPSPQEIHLPSNQQTESVHKEFRNQQKGISFLGTILLTLGTIVFLALLAYSLSGNKERSKTPESTQQHSSGNNNSNYSADAPIKTCAEPDQTGSYRNTVVSRLQSTGKIPTFVEFNGNGNYVVQAYDTEYGVTFGGYVKVNKCGEILDVNVNVDN